MTAAEFDRRVAAAQSYAWRPVLPLWIGAAVGMLMMFGALFLEEKGVPVWVGITGMFMLLGFGMAGLAVGLVREGRAAREFGLLCAECGQSLPGGRYDEITAQVRKTGCCRWCGAPALEDHPGAVEAAAREAALPRSAPHASALTREEFNQRLASFRARMRRRMTVFLAVGLGGMPLLVLVAFLPLEREVRVAIMRGGLFIMPAVLVWTLFGRKAAARRLGLECPACRRSPLDGPDVSVVRTGICPHCSAVIIQPPA